MLGAWLIAAGSASLAMIGLGFRAFSRARAREGIGPVEFEPDDGWESLRPEPVAVARGEEALSAALEIH